MKETNKTGTRFISCVLAVMMIVTTLTGIFPATVSAVTESDVGSEMWSNVYLDALAYTGYTGGTHIYSDSLSSIPYSSTPKEPITWLLSFLNNESQIHY